MFPHVYRIFEVNCNFEDMSHEQQDEDNFLTIAARLVNIFNFLAFFLKVGIVPVELSRCSNKELL